MIVEVLNDDGKGWTAFEADDMQLEFVMLDAYVREGMQSNSKGLFWHQFTIPDQNGVFKAKKVVVTKEWQGAQSCTSQDCEFSLSLYVYIYIFIKCRRHPFSNHRTTSHKLW